MNPIYMYLLSLRNGRTSGDTRHLSFCLATELRYSYMYYINLIFLNIMKGKNRKHASSFHLFERNKTVRFIKRIIDIAYKGHEIKSKPQTIQYWLHVSLRNISILNNNKMSLISYHAFYCHLRMRSSNRTTLSDSACQSTFRGNISVQ